MDCCLGSFILPWAKDNGVDLKPFDLSVEGVTTISVDHHKVYFNFIFLTK